jgi:hypothetical protein
MPGLVRLVRFRRKALQPAVQDLEGAFQRSREPPGGFKELPAVAQAKNRDQKRFRSDLEVLGAHSFAELGDNAIRALKEASSGGFGKIRDQKTVPLEIQGKAVRQVVCEHPVLLSSIAIMAIEACAQTSVQQGACRPIRARWANEES